MAALMLLTACNKSNEKSRYEVAPVAVKTLTVQCGTVDGNDNYSGVVEEADGSSVGFTTMGTVKSVNFKLGQKVCKGQVLATLDDTSLSQAYNTAQATLSQAQDAYNRMKQLHEKGSLAEIKWVDVQTALQQATAAEQIAHKALSDATLRAPISGTISGKSLEVGQTVLPGQEALRIMQTSALKVKFSVPEREIQNIKEGQPVTIDIDNKLYNGKITEKGISASVLSRQYEVKALILEASADLLPGMIASVQPISANRSQRIVLPVSLLQLDTDNRQYVWVNEKGEARRRFVQIGEILPEGIVITCGLEAGDQVITEGRQKVSEGSPITE